MACCKSFVYRIPCKQSSIRRISDPDLKFMLELEFYIIGLSLVFRQVVQPNIGTTGVPSLVLFARSRAVLLKRL
jgi:hypothetical protein